jgi:hypothetical protein
MDPGIHFHHGQARAVGGYGVSVERFDDEIESPGEVRIHISQPREEALTLVAARLLALALLDAVAEGKQ